MKASGSTLEVPAKGGRFGVKYAFNGANGAKPTAGLIQDNAGNLYGTTSTGGSGLGVVFKLDSSNNESLLHTFTGGPNDGATPNGKLLLDDAGNLYGTTTAGGTSNLGTVFKIDAQGNESVLHSFGGNGDGANPYAGVIMDSFGNLFGTTENGGTSGVGALFEIDALGNESVVHNFAGAPSDGADPRSDLILDSQGNLYGTTYTGGTSNYGTVFEFATTTGTLTTLYSFTGGADGGNPFGGVVLDAATGILYGTTQNGGSGVYGCCKGLVFLLQGTNEKPLYTFGGGHDGGNPIGDLLLNNGSLYGTTLSGGPGRRGTAYSVEVSSGNESILHGFTGKADGSTPHGGLLMDASGVLYGTAEKGGRYKQGTVFRYKIKK